MNAGSASSGGANWLLCLSVPGQDHSPFHAGVLERQRSAWSPHSLLFPQQWRRCSAETAHPAGREDTTAGELLVSSVSHLRRASWRKPRDRTSLKHTRNSKPIRKYIRIRHQGGEDAEKIFRTKKNQMQLFIISLSYSRRIIPIRDVLILEWFKEYVVLINAVN